MEQEREIHLPPGYRLDRGDPDVWALRRPEGWVVAHFSARGVIEEAIEEAAWADHEGAGEEQHLREQCARLHTLLQLAAADHRAPNQS